MDRTEYSARSATPYVSAFDRRHVKLRQSADIAEKHVEEYVAAAYAAADS